MIPIRSDRCNATYLRTNLADSPQSSAAVSDDFTAFTTLPLIRTNLGIVTASTPEPTSPIPTDGLIAWFMDLAGFTSTPFVYGSDNTVSTEFTIIGLTALSGTSTFAGAAFGLFAANDEIRWCCSTSTNNRVTFLLYDNAYIPNSTGVYFDGLTANTYYCWTWRFKSGDSNIIRKDGTQVYSNTYTQDFSATKDINIRATVTGNSSYHFNGKIKSVLAWNRKLSDSEMEGVEDYLMGL